MTMPRCLAADLSLNRLPVRLACWHSPGASSAARFCARTHNHRVLPQLDRLNSGFELATLAAALACCHRSGASAVALFCKGRTVISLSELMTVEGDHRGDIVALKSPNAGSGLDTWGQFPESCMRPDDA